MAINKKPQNSGSGIPEINSDATIEQLESQSLHPESGLHELTDNLPDLVSVTSPKDTTMSQNLTVEQPIKRPFWKVWQLWGILLVLCSGGIGYGATSMLLKLPKAQSCSQVFWPIASASVRLYCAQNASEEDNVAGLLKAIDLVAVLPEDHPLRPEIDRNIDRWATGILDIGEEEFQSGKLKQAIATAKQIPEGVSAQELVEQRIEQWNEVWNKGEEIYAKVEDKLRAAEWNAAFTWAVRLTDSSNEYWATTKYEESINNINVAQEENASLTKAQTQITQGSIDDLLLAIDKADDIKANSYAYDQAQKIMADGKTRLVNHVERLIEQQEWQELLQITGRLPRSLKLQKRNLDWQILANAGSSAELDTVFGMEEAIEEAQKLEKDSEYYKLGQRLIKRWELEIKDVGYLSKARDLARVGTIANLNKAIGEASLIPQGNPRYKEARRDIAAWRGEIQIIEDRPILNRARELSYGNNVRSWQRAIAEANLITRSSPLYEEAQGQIDNWRSNIQRVEDQPLLDEAESFANVSNYVAAIESASKIRSGRALYPEARRKIGIWQQEINGQRYMREANNLAAQGTPEALAKAIRTARQASGASSVRSEMVRGVNDWAAQILAIARQTSNTSLARAIAIAQQVPTGTTSFNPAQKEIKVWQIKLNPPQPEVIPPTFKLDKLRKEREN